ncbi:MAG: VacJ family lipoprotein [Alphaproteobacteria bacterium]|jgi:phospholipid-binding lipoprotein MlaA|nr:VacJ family lipoprotein [Alphaproteobacteria bacterium]
MHSTSLKYRFFAVTTLTLMISVMPSLAGVLKEALPSSQGSSEPSTPKPETTPKPEPKKEEPKAVPGEKEAAPEAAEETFMEEEGPNDPLEPLNRVVFGINDFLDIAILRPVAEIYRAIMPEPVRKGVTNILDNSYSPIVFVNHVLQGSPERATVTLFRFLVNSTLGVLGTIDLSSELGFSRYDTGFNETLTKWGLDTGPYLVLPLIGPSSFRGTAGFVGDYYADPLNWFFTSSQHRDERYLLTVRYGIAIVSEREKVIETIKNIKDGSLDYYVTMRSIYFQRQAYMAEKLKSWDTPGAAKTEEKSSTS